MLLLLLLSLGYLRGQKRLQRVKLKGVGGWEGEDQKERIEGGKRGGGGEKRGAALFRRIGGGGELKPNEMDFFLWQICDRKQNFWRNFVSSC